MLKDKLVIGISTRALFDLDYENELFVEQGPEAYVEYMVAHEKLPLKKGPAFGLIQSLLALNTLGEEQLVEVIIMSQNSADSSLRIFNSIEFYGLDITRAALTTGSSILPYLSAYNIDLYLSVNEEDVTKATIAGIAAATVLASPDEPASGVSQIRIAFDGDCVLFNSESEIVYRREGLEAFGEHEKSCALIPLKRGPFANLLVWISKIQSQFQDANSSPIRTAIVTARCAPAHERVIRTFRAWGVRIDEAHFLGGMDKTAVLAAFGAHIFFDDNDDNIKAASTVVLAAKVPNFLQAVI
ncbi:MAG: 5'-nucleotidase [Pseudobutyrivibrio sp.]|nr:5'-nucleotidase [Pseudobutyrivibrio sp.]